MTNIHRCKRLRGWPVYALAASVPVSIAAVSLSKLAVLLVALWLLLYPDQRDATPYRWGDWSTGVVLFFLAALAMSMIYSTAPWQIAAIDLVKYVKLLLIVLIPYLISTREQAYTGLAVYGAVQIFVLLSSWLLAFGIELPWVLSTERSEMNSVFHLYLHQSIMTVGLAALCWHLRHEFKARWFRVLAPILGILALVNVMFLLKGRSGYFAAVTVIAAALLWETRRRWRWLALLIPILIVALALLTSPQFQSRARLVATEALAYQVGNDPASSTASRLNFWYHSVRAIAERPLTGFGAGSWGGQYRRLDGGSDLLYKGSGGNPHQEYLLWGVMLGMGGIGLLVALLATLWWDARSFSPPHTRALRSIILILAITAMFNSVLYDGIIGDYFCLLLGLLLALGKTNVAATTATTTLTGQPTRVESS